MKNWIIIIIALAFSTSVWSQTQQAEQSDPKATAILEKLKTTYESYNTMKASFSLILEIPEEGEEIQNGTILQKGDKYSLEMDRQSIYCDGETIWVHLKNINEVQISDAEEMEEDDDMMSPKDLLRIYEKDDYLYGLTNEFEEDGVIVQQIEFKPTDRDSEYSKLRLTVEKKTSKVMRIKAFSKDGSRFTLKIKNLSPNVDLEDELFVFNKEKNPEVNIEDLRW